MMQLSVAPMSTGSGIVADDVLTQRERYSAPALMAVIGGERTAGAVIIADGVERQLKHNSLALTGAHT
jgi:hypothetical protein